MTTTTTPKTIQIHMSERRPLSIDVDLWPLIASADNHDGRIRCQANQEWAIRVRECANGRRVVYGWLREGNGGVVSGWRGASGGFIIEPPISGKPDDDETVRAIRRVGGIIGDSTLADECIASLPAEPLDTDTCGISLDKLALLLALLVRVQPFCPPAIQDEIRDALRV